MGLGGDILADRDTREKVTRTIREKRRKRKRKHAKMGSFSQRDLQTIQIEQPSFLPDRRTTSVPVTGARIFHVGESYVRLSEGPRYLDPRRQGPIKP